MNRPDFLCIGAQKAATSWLEVMLRQHDEIFLPPMKEVHFFDFVHLPEHRWARGAFARTAARLGRKNPELVPYLERLTSIPRRKDEWYSAVFDHPGAEGRLKGEITPAYSLLPEEGVRHVRRINPQMRIILIIRDPVDRALSHLRMAAQRRKLPEMDAATLERLDILSGVLARSAYREMLARWEAEFPAERMLILPYAQVRRDPDGFLRRVESFLGVSHHAYGGAEESVHQTQPVTLAPELKDMLETRLGSERAWLAERFGEDFLRGEPAVAN